RRECNVDHCAIDESQARTKDGRSQHPCAAAGRGLNRRRRQNRGFVTGRLGDVRHTYIVCPGRAASRLPVFKTCNTEEQICLFGQLSDLSNPSRRSKARAYTCAGHSASETHPTSIRFSCSTTSATTFRTIIWRASPGIPIAGLRLLPTFSPE